MKLFRKIHLWLSVPFGIIISLVCFSGAMLVFEEEVSMAVRSDVYKVATVRTKPLPVDVLMEKVRLSLPDSVSITGVTIFADPARTYQVSLSKPRRASLFVDQYTGGVTGRYERLGFFSTMFRLHRWLLDSANPHAGGLKVGKLIVGISTLVFVIALITGVIIWIPAARRNLCHSLAIDTKNGQRKFWHGVHVAGGMYALIIVLAMALTGLTWSFGWYRTAFYSVFGVEQTARQQPTAENSPRNGKGKKGDGHRAGKRHGSEFKDWNKIYEELRVADPGASKITVSSKPKTAPTPAEKMRKAIYSVHTGTFGGIFTRILWFLAALLGASLPLTGYYLWFKHRR